MSKEKQIKELVKDFCPLHQEFGSCEQCNQTLDIDNEPCYYGCVANIIVNNNYRKAADVAKEIAKQFRVEMRSLIEISEDLYTKSGDDDYYLGRRDAFFTAAVHLEELIKNKYTKNEDTE